MIKEDETNKILKNVWESSGTFFTHKYNLILHKNGSVPMGYGLDIDAFEMKAIERNLHYLRWDINRKYRALKKIYVISDSKNSLEWISGEGMYSD